MATAFQIETCPASAALSDCFSLDVHEAPDGPRQAERSHRRLAVTLAVTEGVVYLEAGPDEQVLTPGDSITILPGTPYRRWNAGDDHAAWIEIFQRR